MNYFLIDYENVNVAGFDGLSNLTAEDVVIVFYTENAETLTFDLHTKINESKAKIQFQKVSAKSKNALDFQLCSYLGYLIRGKIDNKNRYYIVSKDNGYSVLSEYWSKQRGEKVLSVLNLKKDSVKPAETIKQETSTNQPSQPVAKSTNKSSELEKSLSGIVKNKNDIAEISKILNESKDKIEVHNRLQKKFDSQKAGEIYRATKSLISK